VVVNRSIAPIVCCPTPASAVTRISQRLAPPPARSLIGHRAHTCTMCWRRIQAAEPLRVPAYPQTQALPAALIWALSKGGGRSPRRPRAAAAITPSRVRSKMISHSIEPSATKMLNMERPLWRRGVDAFGQRSQRGPAPVAIVGAVEEVQQAASMALEPPETNLVSRRAWASSLASSG
jgi:hypothetical protein